MAKVSTKNKKEIEMKSESVPAVSAAVAVSGALRGKLWLVHPHVSEKTARGETEHQYTFLVDPKVNKNIVKSEIERFYKVNVLRVNITRLPAKMKQWMRREGAQSIRKKATVKIKEGQKIEII